MIKNYFKINRTLSWAAGLGVLLLVWPTAADEDHAPAQVSKGKPALIQSQAGANAWNAGQLAQDWWEEIRRQHGHVGPWNVLGWRIAQAALRELKAEWGHHELEFICYVPPTTPFACLADGLSVGSGNSIGRMDLRLAEVMDYRQSFVAVRRKDGQGGIMEFRPQADYLKSITNQPVEKLEQLSRECRDRPEARLFKIVRLTH